MKYILGKKIGMTQIFGDKGIVVPCTVVEAGPCVVTQVKTDEKDGYVGVQIAFNEIRKALVNKAEAGVFKKANTTPKRYIKEFRIDGATDAKLGDTITCETFSVGDVVDVTAKTKGRGWAGVIKRWNFQRHPMTHGASRVHRAGGSLGEREASHVMKGKKMSGHYGNETVTIQNLEIVKIDKEKNCLFIKGGIPGAEGGLVTVKSAVKRGAK